MFFGVKEWGMKKNTWILAGLVPALLFAASVSADSQKDEPSPPYVARGGTTIPDDTYNGTLATMACVPVAVAAGTVQSVVLDIGLTHTWIGDLTVKLQSPTGTTIGLMSRPGLAEAADDGTGCCGDSSDINVAVTFQDGGTTDAETMGSTITGTQFVCTDDGLCDYFPNPGASPGGGFATFIGEEALGNWQVCVGDSAAGDTGEISSVNLVVAALAPVVPSAPVPALDRLGLAVLAAVLMLGVFFLRRR